jgi:hypothetical protein
MQQVLPLGGLSSPPPLAWERLAPGEQAETIAVLARLMARLVSSRTRTRGGTQQ